MKKSIVLFVATAALSFAGLKSYDVTFVSPAVVGSTQLESGQYKLTLDGTMVKLVNANTRKSFEIPATVQTAEKKFNETVVQSKHVDGKDMVDEIQLRGTTTALDFKH